MRLMLLLFALIMTASCGGKVASPSQPTPMEPLPISLKLERTVCHGRCPAYVLTVAEDGKVVFDGKEFTKTAGKAEDKLSAEKLREIANEVEKAGFFGLRNSYSEMADGCPAMWTDHPTVTLTVKRGSQEKKIVHDLGCQDRDVSGKSVPSTVFPESLYLLENRIDEIVETKRWTVGD